MNDFFLQLTVKTLRRNILKQQQIPILLRFRKLCVTETPDETSYIITWPSFARRCWLAGHSSCAIAFHWLLSRVELFLRAMGKNILCSKILLVMRHLHHALYDFDYPWFERGKKGKNTYLKVPWTNRDIHAQFLVIWEDN